MKKNHQESVQKSFLRPSSFDDFVGQRTVVKNLKIFLEGARLREKPLDHVLLSGPAGLGKTTLAYLVAQESSSLLKITSGPALTKPGDLVALLTNLRPKEVLFIDEIHRLPIALEEMLYSAMEDFRLDIVLGKDRHRKSLSMTLEPFTVIGATTRAGLLSKPLRHRFGIALSLSFYEPQDLHDLLKRGAKKMKLTLQPEALDLLAHRSRGTPRLALRLLHRVWDFALVAGQSNLDASLVSYALESMDIYDHGLDSLDYRYLETLKTIFKGGPAGLHSLCSSLSESADTLEDTVEPFLLQEGFICRGPKGRQLTEKGWNFLHLTEEEKNRKFFDLL